MLTNIRQQLEEQLSTLHAQQLISNSPLLVPRRLMNTPGSSIADIELGAILSALVAWGEPHQSVLSATILMEQCNWKPYEYIRYGDFYELDDDCKIYRTMKGKEFKATCHNLRQVYAKHNSIRDIIQQYDLKVENLLLELSHILAPARLGSPERNSACKRINLLLRWMVRKDDVDLGVWQVGEVCPRDLYAIVDSSGIRSLRQQGFITYPNESWAAVLELTHTFRRWDANDPLKYHLAMESLSLHNQTTK